VYFKARRKLIFGDPFSFDEIFIFFLGPALVGTAQPLPVEPSLLPLYLARS